MGEINAGGREGENGGHGGTSDSKSGGKPVQEAAEHCSEGEKQGDPEFVAQLHDIYNKVIRAGGHNYNSAQVRVPSGLCVEAWKEWLDGYEDQNLVKFIEFGWPVNFDKACPLGRVDNNHPSALNYTEHLEYYIDTELGHRALAGPFGGPPFTWTHISPLMTRPKKESEKRRVIMDLSWPHGASVNDGVTLTQYVDGPAVIKLPTVDYMEGRMLTLGRGAFLYKTDLARGYRQLRVDPGDWPLLGFKHLGKYYVDICPPFGLRTSALCMQRTTEAISWMHGQQGFISRPYLDDFGGAEPHRKRAEEALNALQIIMRELGVVEAINKICRPAQQMVWLGLLYDTLEMTITIPPEKLQEIMQELHTWEGKVRATQREMQRLLGLLQFVAGVSPPTRVFTNRMLENMREMPKRGSESLSLGFKKDLKFFLDVLPEYNGVKVVDKEQIQCQDQLELDASLEGCGAWTGESYYAERFPLWLREEQHPIAHLELLNVVVAVKVWGDKWRGHRVAIITDNMNTCLAVQSGRSRDPFMHQCVRELFVLKVRFDIEMHIRHQPGKELVRADALSRMCVDRKRDEWVKNDVQLRGARRMVVPENYFRLLSDI